MKNNIVVVFSSHLSEDENWKFIEHIDNTIGCKHTVVCYPNHNQFSLSQIYNQALKDHYEKDSIFVCCHNDIIIKTQNWGKILLAKFNNTNFDIIGVAGSTYLPESGRWWDDPSKMLGIVEHTNGLREWVSTYSAEIYSVKETVLIDGLFMSFDPDNIVHRFDETYKGFHFYDLSFCVPNYLDGCEVGVTTSIRILHKSVGMTNEQWEINRQQFVKDYKEELPITYSKYENYDEDILINIITRTHGRPEYFKRCRESIENQSYKNINHIVGSDIECDYYDNVINLPLKAVQQPQLMSNYNTYPAPWNLHLNELGTYVKNGWVMYLDDDDIFSHKNAIKFIVNEINNDDEILFWRVKININERGWIVPNDAAFGKRIEAGNFSGIGFMFNSKHLPVDWGSWSYGDFRVVSEILIKKINPRWIDFVLTETQGKPNNGQPPSII